jgi:uncharacterized RDD family membrane protein YckC
LAHSKPDPEFNPYVAPQSDFETNPETGGPGALEGAGEPNYAGISKRLCAFLLDGFFICLLIEPMLFLVEFFWYTPFSISRMSEEILIDFLARSMGSWLYFAMLESSHWQATIGKRIMGIKVTTLEGGRIAFFQGLGRFMGKIASVSFCFLGLFIQPFTAKKQALHDLLAETLVVDTRG